MKKELEDKFQKAWKKLRPNKDHVAIFKRLSEAYSEPHRFYHNLNHITHCLNEFEQIRDFVPKPKEVEFAIWTHGWVYNLHRSDNEEKSCLAAVQALQKAQVSYPIQKDVWRLIMATKPGVVLKHDDENFLVDIDISIFGQPSDVFDVYEQQIRKEYEWVPEEKFKQARAEILKGYLDRDSIFHTLYFQKKYEDQARLNLEKSFEALSG